MSTDRPPLHQIHTIAVSTARSLAAAAVPAALFVANAYLTEARARLDEKRAAAADTVATYRDVVAFRIATPWLRLELDRAVRRQGRIVRAVATGRRTLGVDSDDLAHVLRNAPMGGVGTPLRDAYVRLARADEEQP